MGRPGARNGASMDQDSVPAGEEEPTPLFGAYRRGGYDPDQVDRYVADQARRLEETHQRASEAERRLAAAVGQLRELHRRVAVLESEDRSPQPPSLDTLGERVQRILQEAWEGAYALRQGAEQEVAELRERAGGQAEEIVAAAEARARVVDEEIERRRKAYLARLEDDRARAVAQVSYLHEQRRVALSELIRVKEVIEATVGEAAASRAATAPGGPGLPSETSEAAPPSTPAAPETDPATTAQAGERDLPPASAASTEPERTPGPAFEVAPVAGDQPDAPEAAPAHAARSGRAGPQVARPLPPRAEPERAVRVRPVETSPGEDEFPERSELVRNHRSRTEEVAWPSERIPEPATEAFSEAVEEEPPAGAQRPSAGVFDFEEE